MNNPIVLFKPLGLKSFCSLLILLSFLYPGIIVGSLQLQHLALVAIFIFAILKLPSDSFCIRMRSVEMLLCASLVIIFSLLSLFFHSPEKYFLDELGKLVIFFVGVAGLLSFYSSEEVLDFLSKGAILSTAYIVFYLLTHSHQEIYSYGGRLQVPGFGSPNALATMSAIYSICLLKRLRIYLGMSGRGGVTLACLLSLFFYLYLIVATSSRGGAFSFVLGFLIYVSVWAHERKKLSLLFFWGGFFLAALLMCLLMFGQFDGALDRYIPSDGYGSGRLMIWERILNNLMENVIDFLIGFGPGSIDIEVSGSKIISAHSFFLSVFYYFGFLGGVSVLGVIGLSIFKMAGRSRGGGDIRLGILFAVLFSFSVDYVLLSSQSLLTTAMAFSLVLGESKGKRFSDAFLKREVPNES
ncbi:O-antigen ligase family protein [Chromohalobacter israelensis]|uniref:O-antigen ligase family protein n=1 Tax=Chromohalobacter israelensis TaxID=141390 RepID=UPI001CC79A11|nr:O-antigen ligase family protein [Chromohalobacter salexigens]MBZ5876640.1 O-antigen ligase family protein [Chromohalobacter salexigens]